MNGTELTSEEKLQAMKIVEKLSRKVGQIREDLEEEIKRIRDDSFKRQVSLFRETEDKIKGKDSKYKGKTCLDSYDKAIKMWHATDELEAQLRQTAEATIQFHIQTVRNQLEEMFGDNVVLQTEGGFIYVLF